MSGLNINSNIALLRKKNGLTQDELAKELNVSNQSVSKWESAICCPDIQLLPKIAELFQVSIDELMGYKPVVRTTEIEAKCSFCSKKSTSENKIVQGPNAFICKTCATLCVDLLQELRKNDKL